MFTEHDPQASVEHIEPYGWEVRDQAVGVLGTGPLSVHQALLFRQLSDDVAFFPDARQLTGEECIPADPTGGTDVPGVWVAGNVADLTAHVGGAAAAGALAGAHINADLVAEETRSGSRR